jgi:phage terminase Nu1 subunit (DNA packaging protein)
MSKNRGIVLVACIPVTVKIQEPDLTPEDFDKLVESLRKSVVKKDEFI